MKINTKTWFTLIEVIVTIVILVILATISFLSFQSYNKNARDSVRVNDISNMTKSLDLYYSQVWRYPSPDDSVDINYSWTKVFSQWEFWESVLRKLDSLSQEIVDPLSRNYYAYSILNNKKEYQIWSILETSPVTYNSLDNLFIEKTYASSWTIEAIAYLKWNYNEQVAEVSTWWLDYIIALPSIITTDLNVINLSDLYSQNKFVYNSYANLPASYSGTNYKLDSGFSFWISDFIAYSWSINDLKNFQAERLELASSLKTIYDSSDISSSSEYSLLKKTTIDLWNPSRDAISLADNILIRLGYEPRNTVLLADVWSTSDIPTVWWDIPDDLTLMFASGSIYVDTWDTNTCDYESMTVVEVLAWTDTLPSTLVADTIYELWDWDYITSSGNGITLMGCTAIIWNENTNLYSSSEISSDTDWLIKWVGISNTIVYWISLDWENDWAWSTHNKSKNGIYFSSLSNSTIWNSIIADFHEKWLKIDNSDYNYIRWIDSNNNSEDGIYIAWGSSQNTFYDNVTHNNNQSWLEINGPDNNIITLHTSYANTYYWYYLQWSASQNTLSEITAMWNNSDWINMIWDNVDQNTISNSIVLNNWGDWIELNDWDNNIFTNLRTYNNSDHWVFLDNGSENNTFNNIMSFNNINYWFYLDDSNSDNNAINNSIFFNNASYGVYIRNWDNNMVHNSQTNSNNNYGIYTWSDNSAKIIDINSFNNTNHWVKKTFWNLYYYWNSNIKNPDTCDWCTQGTDSFLWFSNWAINTTLSFSSDLALIPSVVSWTWEYDTKWKQASVTFDWTETYTYWSSLPFQSQPIKYDWSNFVFYWTWWIDYNTLKRIWEW